MSFARARRAFTLIELLVVIGIIAILIAISVIVGARVGDTGKGMATAETIRVLDAAMGDYINSVGSLPPLATRVEWVGGPAQNVYPIIDGRDMGTEKYINTIGLFIRQTEGTSGVGTAIAQIDNRYVRRYDPDGAGPQPELTTVFDAWDRPIRYVHPALDGIWVGSPRTEGQAGTAVDLSAGGSPIKDQTLRNNLAITSVRRAYYSDADRAANANIGTGDSDGGLCPSPKPYFYSAGEDGDPSTLKDNIYTTKPNTEVE